MTTQEAYEKMRAWLTRPGATRAHNGMYCEYATRDGNRCAIGGILSPAALSEVHDLHGSVDEIIGDQEGWYDDGTGAVLTEPIWPTAYAELKDVEPMFLGLAQTLHDYEENWADGVFDVAQLDALAACHGLTVVTDEQASEAPLVRERELVTVA